MEQRLPAVSCRTLAEELPYLTSQCLAVSDLARTRLRAQVFMCYLECGNAFRILKNNRSGWIAESIALRSAAHSVDLGGHTTNRLSVNGEGQEAPLFGLAVL